MQSCIKIEYITRKNEKFLDSVSIVIENEKFILPKNNNYLVSINETVIPETKKTVSTGKFSYELKHENNLSDFIRFDFKYYSNYPNFHINADKNKWGDHLTYPETTNINLENLDCIKTLNIFQKYVKNPHIHILDQNNNSKYLDIL